MVRTTMAALLLGLIGCSSISDPTEPWAMGTVSLDLVDPTPYSALAVRMVPVGGTGGYADDTPLPVGSPYQFEMGGGIGVTGYQDYQVRAWLTTDLSLQEPAVGEPQATMPVHFDCERGHSCPLIGDLELVLQP